MAKNTAVIGKETRIPLGVVWTLCGALVAFVFWITTMHVDVKYLKDDVAEIKSDVKQIKEHTSLKRVAGD